MKGVISWDYLNAKERDFILSRKGLRCELCKSLGKFGIVVRASLAFNCLNDLTFLYLLKRTIGLPHEKAKEQTIKAGLIWGLLRAKDQLMDSDATLITRAFHYTVIESMKMRVRRIKEAQTKIVFETKNSFDSLAEWLEDISSPFQAIFAYGCPKRHTKTMRKIGKNLGILTALKDALVDMKLDMKYANFNPLLSLDEKTRNERICRITKNVSKELLDCCDAIPLQGQYSRTTRKLLLYASNLALTFPSITQTSSNCGTSSSSYPSCSDPCTCLILLSVCACIGTIIEEAWKHGEKKQKEERERQLREEVRRLERELQAERARQSVPSPPKVHITEIRCDACGFVNPLENEHCGRCGARLEKERTRIY